MPPAAPRPHEAPRRVSSASSSPLTMRGRMPGSAWRRARNALPSRACRAAAVATSRTSRAPRARARSRYRRTAASVRSTASGASVPRAASPSPRRVTAWSAHRGTSPIAGSASATRTRTVLVPRSMPGEEPRHLERAEARPRSEATVARSVSSPTGFSTTASIPWFARVCGSTRPGQPVTRTTGSRGPRPLGRAGHLEPGAARQHEVRHHEIDGLAPQEGDRLAHVARGPDEIALALEPLDQGLPHGPVVVDQQDTTLARGARAWREGRPLEDPPRSGGEGAPSSPAPARSRSRASPSVPRGHGANHRQADSEASGPFRREERLVRPGARASRPCPARGPRRKARRAWRRSSGARP